MTRSSPSRLRRILRSPVAVRLLSVGIVLLAWELYGRQYPVFTSFPTEIAAAFVRTFNSETVPALASTLHGFVVGFGIAAPAGIAIGLAMGRSRLVDVILSPYVNALYVTPRITLIPLLVLWLGIAFELRVAIVVLSAVFPIIVNVQAGAREVDREMLDLARAFVASRRQRLTTIILPGTVPYVFTGLRLGLARALTGIVVAEMTAAISGLGRLIISKARFLRTDELFVPIIVIGVIAIVLTAILVRLQHRAARWQHLTREL